VLRLKFVTRSPEVLSTAVALPRPCGYFALSAVQLRYRPERIGRVVDKRRQPLVERLRHLASASHTPIRVLVIVASRGKHRVTFPTLAQPTVGVA
jgi:hypothetical protein